jgi:hypothetical protein
VSQSRSINEAPFMSIRAPKDFWSGLMFLTFAAVTLVAANGYSLGRGGRMGPGYFPTVLGAVLAVLGLVLLVRSFAINGDAIERIQLRPLIILTVCVILFGLMIQPLGLVIALTVTTFVAALAGRDIRLKEAALLSSGLTVLAVLIFVVALRLPLPIWPSL